MYIVDGPDKPVPPPVVVLSEDEAFYEAFNNGDMPLETIAAYINAARLKQYKKINAWRLAANNTTFTYKGKEIDCDALSRSDIEGTNGIILNQGKMPLYGPGGWKTRDNSYVAISTVADWHAFYEAMYNQGLMNFAKSQAMKVRIAAATTLEAIRNEKW